MLSGNIKRTLEGVLAGTVLLASSLNSQSQQTCNLSLQKSNNTIIAHANNLNISNNYSLLSSPTVKGLFSAPSEKTNFSATENSMSFSFPIRADSEFFRLMEYRPLIDDGQMKVMGGRKSGNNFEFEAINLTPGNFYSPYSINITDQFVPLKRKSTVVALTTTQTFSVPMNSTNEFLGVIDLDKYTGSDLKTTYPDKDQIVSGSNVRVGFSSHDIFPHRVEAFVEDSIGNYKYLGNIEEGQPEFSFNSQILQNGPAKIYLVATGKEGIPVTLAADPQQPEFGEQESIYYFSTRKSLDVIISNNIYAEAFEDITESRSGYLNLVNLDNSDTQNYIFKVRDENNNLFKEEIFNFTDGRASLNWDGSSNGYPIELSFDDINYSVERINGLASSKKYSAKEGGIHISNIEKDASNSNLVFQSTSFFSGGIILKPRLFVATEFPEQPQTDLVYRLVDTTKNSTDFWALLDIDREPISRGSYALYNNPIKVTPANQMSEGPMTLNIITNRGNGSFFYIGHGSPTHIVGDPSEPSIHYQLNARNIAIGLDNSVSYKSLTMPDGTKVRRTKYKLNGRLLDSWLHSCSGILNESFSVAFGTPPIDFTKYPNVSPSIFFGYKGIIPLSYDLENFARITDLRWVSDWNAMNSIDVSLSENPKILPAEPAANGHPFVTYARGALRR